MDCPYIIATLDFIVQNYGQELQDRARKKSGELWKDIYKYVHSVEDNWDVQKHGKPYIERTLRKFLKATTQNAEGKPWKIEDLFLYGPGILVADENDSENLISSGEEDEDTTAMQKLRDRTLSRAPVSGSNMSITPSPSVRSSLDPTYVENRATTLPARKRPAQQAGGSVWKKPRTVAGRTQALSGSVLQQSPIQPPISPLSSPVAPVTPKQSHQRQNVRAESSALRLTLRLNSRPPQSSTHGEDQDPYLAPFLYWATEHNSSSPYQHPSAKQLKDDMIELGLGIFQAVHMWYGNDTNAGMEAVVLQIRRFASSEDFQKLLKLVFKTDDNITNLSAIQSTCPLPMHVFLRALIAAAISKEALTPLPHQEILDQAAPVLEMIGDLLKENANETYRTRLFEELQRKVISKHIEPNLVEQAQFLGHRLWILLSTMLIPANPRQVVDSPSHARQLQGPLLPKRSTEFRSAICSAYLHALKLRAQWTKSGGGATYRFEFPRMGDILDSSYCDFVRADGDIDRNPAEGQVRVIVGLLPAVYAEYTQFRDKNMTTDEWKNENMDLKPKVKGQVFILS